MFVAKTLALFFVTAIAEIVGCYLPYLWLKQGGSAWLLLPAAASLENIHSRRVLKIAGIRHVTTSMGIFRLSCSISF